MDFKRVITEFLGLQDVNIEDIKIFKKDPRVEVKVRQLQHKCQCHQCGSELHGVHQWELRKLRTAPIGPFQKVTIKLYYLRAWCLVCDQVRTSHIPFVHPKFKNMTCAFAEAAGRLMEETTCEASARLLDCNSKTLWSLDQWRMMYMLQFMNLPQDMDVSMLCADEVHFRTKRFKRRRGWTAKRWEAEFVTNLVCYNNSKVLYNAVGRGADALENCLSVLSEGQRMAVEFFAVDMHEPFMAAIKYMCPNARICVDRYHLAEQINKRFDQVRKTELSQARKNRDVFQEGMLAPSRRFVLVEKGKEDKLTRQEFAMLLDLRKRNTNIHNAMLLVEYFHKMLEKKHPKTFRSALAQWYQLVRQSKLKPFRKFCMLIRRYRREIESYISSRLTTAVSEGLNNKIKVLKRVGYGYQNPTSFRNKILQRCGFLNSHYIDTRHFFWKIG